ncbi:MAG: DUF5693 family protein [Armatimonadota bacterium]
MPSNQTFSTRGLRRFCLLLMALGLLAAGAGLVQRHRAERSAPAVDLVIDYNEVVALAGKEGIPTEDVIARLREAGATAVALPEETLDSMATEGEISINARPAGATWAAVGMIPDGWKNEDRVFTVITPNPATKAFIVEGLARLYPQENYRVGALASIYIRGSREIVSNFGLGLSPQKVETITRGGLRVVPRLTGGAGLTAENLRAIFQAVADVLPPAPAGGPRGLIVFDGTTIPGYRNLLDVVADELTRNDLVYGAVEFAKQKGDAQLGGKLEGRLVRVHSISIEEFNTLKPAQTIQRFSLAAKDRNIRALYIHLPQLAGNALEDSTTYLRNVADELRRQGFTVDARKPAHPFIPLELSPALLALLFIGAGASAIFWLLSILPAALPARYVIGGFALAILGILLAAGLAFAKPSMGRMLFGLLAAIGFPLLSLTWAYLRLDRLAAQKPRNALLPAIVALVGATAITLAGGLIIAAMFAESRYLVKVGQFTGVKLALVVPLLIFAVLITTDGIARAGETLADYRARCTERLRAVLHQPIYVWGIALAVIGLVALALLVARSGNEGATVSNTELQFRALLERWMVARPRTKEFLFGHPLFLFAMVAGARGQRVLALLLLLGGAIGQVDVLNTYCHAHTPVFLSLLRTFNGLWLGILLGVVLLAIFGWQGRRRKTSEP